MRPALAATCVLVLASIARGGEPPDVAAVIAAATKRQDSVKTAAITYRQTEVDAKGGKSELDPLFKHTTPIPSEETTLISTNRLVIDGVKLRLENNHPVWHMPQGVLRENKAVGVFNGEVAKDFYPDGIESRGPAIGSINKEVRLNAVRAVWLTPITLAFRGPDSAISPYPVTEMTQAGSTLPIDGAACLEYRIDPNPEGSIHFFLDPQRDYVARRIRMITQGRLLSQTDIAYQKNDVCGWSPTSWACNQYSPAGALLTTVKVEVLESEFNAAQPPEQFEFQFPPGTLVYDNRLVKNYRVQADGSMREVTREGEELSGSVPQPGAPWYQGHRWLLGGLVVVLVTAGIFYTIQRKRTRRA